MRLPARKPMKTSTNIKFSDMVKRFYRFIVHALLPLKIARHCDTVRHCMDDFNARRARPSPFKFQPFYFKRARRENPCNIPCTGGAGAGSLKFRTAGLPTAAFKNSVQSQRCGGQCIETDWGAYRNGGNTPKKGFDCSGLVHYVFQNTLGLTLPRRADAMSRIGNKITVDNLQPGDLVFFNTRRRTFSHVGIFIGNHQFVHSPSKGRRVRIDSLDNRYWERHFTGARRLKFRDAASCPRSRFVDRFLGYSGRLNRSMTFILLLVLLLIAAGCALLKWVRTSGFFCCAAGLFFWSVGSGLPAQWLL